MVISGELNNRRVVDGQIAGDEFIKNAWQRKMKR